MTYTKAFEHAGLNATETEFTAFDGSACGWKVTNAQGREFTVRSANWGEFTVYAGEKRLCAHCLFRTAVKLIKTH